MQFPADIIIILYSKGLNKSFVLFNIKNAFIKNIKPKINKIKK